MQNLTLKAFLSILGVSVVFFVALWGAEKCGILEFLGRISDQTSGLAGLIAAVAGLIVAVTGWLGLDAWKKKLSGTDIYQEARKFMRLLMGYRDLLRALREPTQSIAERKLLDGLDYKHESMVLPEPGESDDDLKKRWDQYQQKNNINHAENTLKTKQAIFNHRIGEIQKLQRRLYSSSRELEVLGVSEHGAPLVNVEYIFYDMYQSICSHHRKLKDDILNKKQPGERWPTDHLDEEVIYAPEIERGAKPDLAAEKLNTEFEKIECAIWPFLGVTAK